VCRTVLFVCLYPQRTHASASMHSGLVDVRGVCPFRTPAGAPSSSRGQPGPPDAQPRLTLYSPPPRALCARSPLPHPDPAVPAPPGLCTPLSVRLCLRPQVSAPRSVPPSQARSHRVYVSYKGIRKSIWTLAVKQRAYIDKCVRAATPNWSVWGWEGGAAFTCWRWVLRLTPGEQGVRGFGPGFRADSSRGFGETQMDVYYFAC
jgi:hypothetical protein